MSFRFFGRLQTVIGRPANIQADGHKEKPMIRSYALVAAAAFLGLATTSMGFAQQGGQQQPARSLDTALAVEAAQTAVNVCLDSGVKGSAAVVDSAGVLRVLISANGSSKNSAELSPKKAVLANDLKKPTSEIFSEMDKDPALKAKLEADKNIFPRPGAVPIMAGNDVIGAIGFGGANGAQGGGAKDEACAKAGLDKVRARVK
jgi:uncharacterized protein GlcG (DUF336 family)